MKQSTNRDFQRMTFVESLHESLSKTLTNICDNQERFMTLATGYLSDGLNDEECIELLAIDGLKRDEARNYLEAAKSECDDLDVVESARNAGDEYRFRFHDENGNLWSSYDIGETIYASSEKEAKKKAEQLIRKIEDFELDRIISVTRIS